MNKLKKIFILLTCVIVLTPSINIDAATKPDTTKGNFPYGDANHIEITDKETIALIAEEQNLENPDKISKIIIDKVDIDTNLNSNDFSLVEDPSSRASVTTTTRLDNVVDLGDRYSYWDVYSSYWFDGYLENTKTFEMSASATYSSEISVPTSVVNLKFGIQLGVTAKYTETVKIVVPDGKRDNVKTWVNYKKKTFDIYHEYSTAPGLWYYQGPGSVSVPVGLIITQTLYDK